MVLKELSPASFCWYGAAPPWAGKEGPARNHGTILDEAKLSELVRSLSRRRKWYSRYFAMLNSPSGGGQKKTFDHAWAIRDWNERKKERDAEWMRSKKEEEDAKQAEQDAGWEDQAAEDDLSKPYDPFANLTNEDCAKKDYGLWGVAEIEQYVFWRDRTSLRFSGQERDTQLRRPVGARTFAMT